MKSSSDLRGPLKQNYVQAGRLNDKKSLVFGLFPTLFHFVSAFLQKKINYLVKTEGNFKIQICKICSNYFVLRFQKPLYIHFFEIITEFDEN